MGFNDGWVRAVCQGCARPFSAFHEMWMQDMGGSIYWLAPAVQASSCRTHIVYSPLSWQYTAPQVHRGVDWSHPDIPSVPKLVNARRWTSRKGTVKGGCREGAWVLRGKCKGLEARLRSYLDPPIYEPNLSPPPSLFHML